MRWSHFSSLFFNCFWPCFSIFWWTAREFYQRMRTFVQSLDDETVVPGVIPVNQRNAQESDRKPKQRTSSSTSSEQQPPSLPVAAVQSSPSSPVTDSTTNDSIDCLKSADAGVTVSAESAGDCWTWRVVWWSERILTWCVCLRQFRPF